MFNTPPPRNLPVVDDKKLPEAPFGPRGPLQPPPPVPPVALVSDEPEAEDIFGGLKEKELAPPPSQPQLKDEFPPVVSETPKQGFKRILFFILLAVLGVGIVGGGGFIVFQKFLGKKVTTIEVGPIVVPAPAEIPEAPPAPPAEQAEVPPMAEVPPPAPVDSDADGLTDDEETALGINPFSPDTDADGLSDREEVKVYLTDPLNKDTDKDTYLDGEEVEHGYDPKGPGKLLTIPPPSQP